MYNNFFNIQKFNKFNCNHRFIVRMTRTSLICILLLILALNCMAISSYSQTVRMSIKIDNPNLKEVMLEIKKQTEFDFLYNKDIESLYLASTHLDVENGTIEEILNQLFENSRIDYRIIDKTIVFMPRTIESTSSVQQGISITGIVTDAMGEPLPGVSVMIKGTTQGTATDANGAYSLSIPNENTVLLFSYIGFISQEQMVGNQRVISVTLSETLRELEEVVVIGYGTRKKESLTGGISVVNGGLLKSNPVGNIVGALQGAAPGIDVKTSNIRGGGATIRIHGRGTINNNDPLWVVDGVPGPALNHFNLNDIESIVILKDAASTAIYGARGANGVILINTKQGKKDQPVRIQLSSRVGTNRNVSRFDMLNVEEHAEMVWLQYKNSGVQPNHAYYGNGEKPVFPRYIYPAGSNDIDLSLYNQITFPITEANLEGTDWHNEFFRQGIMQEHSLSMTGSSKNTVFSLGFGYLNEDAIIKTGNYERFTITTNLN